MDWLGNKASDFAAGITARLLAPHLGAVQSFEHWQRVAFTVCKRLSFVELQRRSAPPQKVHVPVFETIPTPAAFEELWFAWIQQLEDAGHALCKPASNSLRCLHCMEWWHSSQLGQAVASRCPALPAQSAPLEARMTPEGLSSCDRVVRPLSAGQAPRADTDAEAADLPKPPKRPGNIEVSGIEADPTEAPPPSAAVLEKAAGMARTATNREQAQRKQMERDPFQSQLLALRDAAAATRASY